MSQFHNGRDNERVEDLAGQVVKATAVDMGNSDRQYPVQGTLIIDDNTCIVETSDRRHHAVLRDSIQLIHPQEDDDPVFLTAGDFEVIKALVSAVPMWERANFLNMVTLMTGSEPSVFLNKLGFEHSPYGQAETAPSGTETAATDGRVSLAPLANMTPSEERLLKAHQADKRREAIDHDAPCPGTVRTGWSTDNVIVNGRRCSLPAGHDGDCR